MGQGISTVAYTTFGAVVDVVIFMLALIVSISCYFIVKKYKNEATCIVIGVWIAFYILSMFIQMMISIFKGIPQSYSTCIAILLPYSITEYLIYKEYMKIKNGVRNV